MSEKIQIGIYRLKDEIVEFKKGKKPKQVTIDITYLNKAFKSKGYTSQKTQPNISSNYDLFLYFKRNQSEIRWKGFIENIADSSEPILKHKKTNNESYVFLLQNIKSKLIYATTGGFGHTAIQEYVEGDFGLEILSRLIKADSKTLRSSKEKNLTGGILGEVKFFRNDYNLNENENFGNFYQELHSALNKKLLTSTFGFAQNEIDSDSLCIAKNSFTIKKSISFNQLVTIIKNCENLIQTKNPIVDINGVKKLNKANKALIAELENELDKSIAKEYLGKVNDISIELCHKDFDKYLHADSFDLNFKIAGTQYGKNFDEPLNSIKSILNEIKKIDSNLKEKDLISIVANSHIESNTSSGDILTSDLTRNHFYTEVSHKGKSYFLSDREWFEIKSSFTQKLNEQCQDFIDDNYFQKKLKKWNYPREEENDFNAKHIGEKDFLVFDKFTPENIEVCDVLYWDSTNIYLIHAKAGFNNSMRDLSHQIYISARRIKEDSKMGYTFIGDLYDKVKNNNGTTLYYKNAKKQLANINKRDFLELFKRRKIVFVLAVLDTASAQRSLSKISNYKSNIAKFSLQELVKNMRNLAMDFEICEISK